MRRCVRALLATSCTVGCVITSPTSFDPLPPLTPPVIVDEPGVTAPRISNLVRVERGDQPVQVSFSVPVDDDGVDDPLQYQFFVNADRDCIPRDGGTNCEPTVRLGEAPTNGTRRRLVRRDIPIPNVGCNRVDLWVSSRFRLSGTYRAPEREGDVAFASWWIFVRPRPGTTPDPDAGAVDTVEQCQYLVQP